MMKKFLCCITASVIICCIICGCGNTSKTSENSVVSKTETTTFSASTMCEISILDYNTEEVLTQFEASDDTKANTVFNTLNNTEDTSEKPKTEPSYIIHFIDNGDSQYDVWYLVYIDDSKLFVCLDSSRTESNNLNLESGLKLCKSTTVAEFVALLNN